MMMRWETVNGLRGGKFIVIEATNVYSGKFASRRFHCVCTRGNAERDGYLRTVGDV